MPEGVCVFNYVGHFFLGKVAQLWQRGAEEAQDEVAGFISLPLESVAAEASEYSNGPWRSNLFLPQIQTGVSSVMLGEPYEWQFDTQLVSACFVAEQAEVPGTWLADVLSARKMSCKNKAGSGCWKSK